VAEWRDRSGRKRKAGVPKADARTDQRRKRWALTEAEFGRLLKVARLRTLAEHDRAIVKKPDDRKPDDRKPGDLAP